MARLSIGSQHFQAKERRAGLLISHAKKHCSADESPTTASKGDPMDQKIQPEHSEEKASITEDLKDSYIQQNRLLAVKNSELAMTIKEMEATISNLKEEVSELRRNKANQLHEIDTNALACIEQTVRNSFSLILESVQNLKGGTIHSKIPECNSANLTDEQLASSTPNHSKASLDISLNQKNCNINALASSRESSRTRTSNGANTAVIEDTDTPSQENIGMSPILDYSNILQDVGEERSTDNFDNITFFQKPALAHSLRKLSDDSHNKNSEHMSRPKRLRDVYVKKEESSDSPTTTVKLEPRRKRRALMNISNNKPRQRDVKTKALDDSIFDFVDEKELLAQSRKTTK